jgi:hypothetical protein
VGAVRPVQQAGGPAPADADASQDVADPALGEATEGDRTEGDRTEGDRTEGDGTEGEVDDERARRAHVPPWDDILLGIRRRHAP